MKNCLRRRLIFVTHTGCCTPQIEPKDQAEQAQQFRGHTFLLLMPQVFIETGKKLSDHTLNLPFLFLSHFISEGILFLYCIFFPWSFGYVFSFPRSVSIERLFFFCSLRYDFTTKKNPNSSTIKIMLADCLLKAEHD